MPQLCSYVDKPLKLPICGTLLTLFGLTANTNLHNHEHVSDVTAGCNGWSVHKSLLNSLSF